jgi:hypothetical protein
LEDDFTNAAGRASDLPDIKGDFERTSPRTERSTRRNEGRNRWTNAARISTGTDVKS